MKTKITLSILIIIGLLFFLTLSCATQTKRLTAKDNFDQPKLKYSDTNEATADLTKTADLAPNFTNSDEGLTKLSKEDMELLLKNVDPTTLKQLAENPGARKKYIENLRQLLAVAEEARKSDEIGKAPGIKDELEDIRTEITAVSYDREKNKDKDQMPPFSTITEDRVNAFYQNPANAAKADAVIKSKIARAQETGAILKDQQWSEEELNEFKDQYAKINIEYKEAQDNWSKLSDEFKRLTELQIKLQQARLLARKYTEKILTKKVGAARKKQILDEIIARNPIQIAEDFEVKILPMPAKQPN